MLDEFSFVAGGDGARKIMKRVLGPYGALAHCPAQPLDMAGN